LTAHRLEHGSFVPEARSLDLVAVVREVVDMVADPTALVHITAPEELLCSGDPDLLREAVANLLTNALRYTPPAAPIRVDIGEENGGACATVQVSDQGPGIAPDLLPHLFERFTTGTGSTGLGLGLYLAREIARTHGGIVTVASAAGRGTTFRLTLPLPAERHAHDRADVSLQRGPRLPAAGPPLGIPQLDRPVEGDERL
jgi:signal transduction histidine kinase